MIEKESYEERKKNKKEERSVFEGVNLNERQRWIDRELERWRVGGIERWRQPNYDLVKG